MNVLIIEDAPLLQRLYVRLLGTMFDPLNVQTTNNADDAIDLLELSLEETPFDLVISDFNLVGPKTGGDVFSWVKSHAPSLLSRFLFVSGNPDVKELHVHYLAKPYEVPMLRGTIAAMTGVMTRPTT